MFYIIGMVTASHVGDDYTTWVLRVRLCFSVGLKSKPVSGSRNKCLT